MSEWKEPTNAAEELLCSVPSLLTDHPWVREAIVQLRAHAAREAELAEARDALQFVERWANYHGVKPTCTAKAALSAIQHYPPIREITESYKDGKIPETRNPWEELSAATDRAEKAEAELARTQEAFESLTLQVSELELSRDAAVKDAERIDWIERTLFDKQWNAVIDSGSRTYWRICGPYRHVTAKMVGGTFRAAIDAAISAKGERNDHNG